MPTTDEAITLFREAAGELLVVNEAKFQELIKQLVQRPLHPYFTCHISNVDNSLITLAQFARVFEKLEKADELLERFLEKFGSDKTVNLQDLAHLLERRGEEFSMEEVERFITESDMDGDGAVGLQDLRKILHIENEASGANDSE